MFFQHERVTHNLASSPAEMVFLECQANPLASRQGGLIMEKKVAYAGVVFDETGRLL